MHAAQISPSTVGLLLGCEKAFAIRTNANPSAAAGALEEIANDSGKQHTQENCIQI